MKARQLAKYSCLLALALMAGGISWAAVTSQPVKTGVSPDMVIDLPLKLDSPASVVAGVNGELVFDTALFSNPQIMQGPGAPSFIVMGNEYTPGHYKFVAYADPTRTMALGSPVLYIRLQAAHQFEHSTISTLTYPMAAASDNTGASLTPCTFADIQISVNSTGAQHWALYE